MQPVLERLTPVLRLTRVSSAFAAMGNVWFVILWTRAELPEQARAPLAVLEWPLWAVLGAGTLLATGLYAFSMVLNDTLDVRRDRTLHPERPLASGRLHIETAVTLLGLTLMTAILGAAMLGLSAVWMCVVTGLAIMWYYGVARYFPALGLVALGLIYGGHMMIPNYALAFVWPVWLVLTHSLAVGAISHRLAERRPMLRAAEISAAFAGWLFWSAALLWVGMRRSGALWPAWVNPMSMVLPTALVIAFVIICWRKLKATSDPGRAAEKIERYGALWLPLYAIGWMAGQGNLNETLILLGLALAGWVGLSVLREVYGLIEQPVGFRRF